jgi:DNA-directed RNA polymerase subunit RPC12/RpoP
MVYKCIECGAEVEYKDLLRSKLKCTSCTEKRSNIWIKARSDNIVKEVYAR